MTSFDAKKLQNVEKEIEEKVGKENAEKYLRLAKKWATGKMSLKTFERKSTSIIPIDVHSEFILYLSEAFNVSTVFLFYFIFRLILLKPQKRRNRR